MCNPIMLKIDKAIVKLSRSSSKAVTLIDEHRSGQQETRFICIIISLILAYRRDAG